jgi:hypothetical protein
MSVSACCCSKVCTDGRAKKVDGVLALVEEGANLGFCGPSIMTMT